MRVNLKKKVLSALLVGSLLMIGAGGEMTEAAVQNANPYGLVYGNAITKNEQGKVNIRPVEYQVDGIKVAANLYLPADYDETNSKTYAAVTVAHPNGGSKEQVAGLYAQRLAELGYIAIAADARYQGASGGEPRLRDYPANRIGDVSGMVDYLSTLKKVDRARIGSLGICGGGGYTLAAAQTDKRIKAVATLSMFNSGRVRRNGFHDADIKGIPARLEKAAEARNKELAGEVVYEGFLPPNTTDEQLRAKMAELPENTLYRDGMAYHCAEIPFVFDNINLSGTATGATKEAYALADKVSDAWISFARTGNPNAKGLPEWPAYTRKNGATMILDNKSEVRYHHDDELMDLLEPDYRR